MLRAIDAPIQCRVSARGNRILLRADFVHEHRDGVRVVGLIDPARAIAHVCGIHVAPPSVVFARWLNDQSVVTGPACLYVRRNRGFL